MAETKQTTDQNEEQGDQFDLSPEDAATFERMNHQTPEERERAIARGRQLFQQAEAELRASSRQPQPPPTEAK